MTILSLQPNTSNANRSIESSSRNFQNRSLMPPWCAPLLDTFSSYHTWTKLVKTGKPNSHLTIKLLSKSSKTLADNKMIKTHPVPAIAHLCQLSHSQGLLPEALINHHKPVEPDCYLVTKVTRIIQDLLHKLKTT